MATRYPARRREAPRRWMPKETTEKDLKDDVWGSDVDMEDESEEELCTDDSLQEFIADNESDDESTTFDSDDDDDTLTLESSDDEWESDAFVSRRTSSPHLTEDPQSVGNVPAHPARDIP